MADRGFIGNQGLGQGGPPDPRGANELFPQRGMGTYKRRKGTEPIKAPYTLEDGAPENETPEAMARLYSESVAYPNLASNKFVREQAKAAVLSAVKDTFNVNEFLRNKWLILYRLYRGESLNQFEYGRTNLHSPEPYKIVETAHPRVMRALYGNDRWFKLYGIHDHSDEAAKRQEMLCRDQLRAANFRDKQSRFVRDGLIYGTAIQKLYWRQEIGEMRYRTAKRKPDDRFQGATTAELTEIKRKELLFDGNEVENVSIFDFFTSPNSSSIDEAEWCMDRSSWPDWKVKQMGELGHWVDLEKLKDHPGSRDSSYGDEFKERKSYAYGIFDPREASHAPHIPHYQVMDWWGPLMVSDESGNYETKICNVVMIEPESLQLVARVTVNPFWHQKKPYQAWRPTKLEDEFYGIGSLEMIARMSMEKDMKRNLLMASAQLEANPMWMVSDDANIPDGQLLLQPGLTLRVPSVSDSIAPLHVPQVSDAALKAENVLTKDIRETSGVTSPTMGAADPFASRKTATQHTAEVDESNQRMIGMIENHEQDVIIPMLDQMTWNNQQFVSYERVVRELGPFGMRFHDRYTIRPEDILGRFLVQPLVSHRLSTKQMMTQQLVNLLDRAPVINQMYGPQAVKMPKLLAFILEQGFDLRNVEDFIGVPPEESGLLTAIEEHELWYHGHVAPRRADDNDMRHVMVHQKELGSERFAQLEQSSPGTAAKARAHLAEHMRKIALQQEMQEKLLMEMAQMQSQMGGGGPAGAASPNQDPDSPQIRRNENERGEGTEAKSEAMNGAPNRGAE